jgi:soluble P-type ATPase
MISINIPGWGTANVENIILDLNGTIATDGIMSQLVKDKIKALSEKVNIYLLTVDTQGTATRETAGINADLIIIPGENSNKGKCEFLNTINTEMTVAIGNGYNDHLILKEATLGIVVLGEEGMSVSAMKNADIVVKNISDAFDLFLKPKRLVATLRK